ncbi:hypothetical protein [Falsirhodobacter deserti]|uniref:hypothetical protein n=1 Tax=Falsirhodobacter deserti TaxID=1365611 RepID=UPI0013E32465|nr:hypothetical protein [Falsirhodobacter deserti]
MGPKRPPIVVIILAALMFALAAFFFVGRNIWHGSEMEEAQEQGQTPSGEPQQEQPLQ